MDDYQRQQTSNNMAQHLGAVAKLKRRVAEQHYNIKIILRREGVHSANLPFRFVGRKCAHFEW